jgi:sigma-E factor negative regulatory protein RseC
MIEELATVVSVHQQNVQLESKIKSTCSSCQQVDNCGNGQVAKALPSRKMKLNLNSDLSLKIGDQVVLGISEEHLLQSAWQVYLWPLLGLIAFSALGQWLVLSGLLANELLAIVMGCCGGYLGFWLAKNSQASDKNAVLLTPKILRIVSKTIAVVEIPSDC